MTAPRPMSRPYDRRRPFAFAALEIGAFLFALACVAASQPDTHSSIAAYLIANVIGILSVTRLRLNMVRLVMMGIYAVGIIGVVTSLAFRFDAAMRMPDILLRASLVIGYGAVTTVLLMSAPVAPWCRSGNLPFFDRMKSRLDLFR
ncbi:hypothetical protein [Croceicoccus hydrothermalis]|uniref:hypothetical protein n=1 Tax=Croceicoccus hydrothermalis TaxID=2867964 RepID=UPI001EFAC5C6|nr:hypothetical protein [Croceicoccus hydrothermalis]